MEEDGSGRDKREEAEKRYSAAELTLATFSSLAFLHYLSGARE